MNTDSVTIFTDGSSRGNPGPGGWGAVVVYNDSELQVESEKWKVKEIGGREAHTTNNRMELMAAIKALEQIPKTQNKIQAVTDSGYLVKGITEWIHNWQKKGWKTANKKPVLNQDLWQELLNGTIHRTITWKQIAGHADTAGNIRADEIATDFADGKTPALYSGALSNYRIRNILDAVR